MNLKPMMLQSDALPVMEKVQDGFKKVLIIAYYWPPAGGPGVQRWLKFVKYLPEFNIHPIVFVPENANYPLIDKDLSLETLKDVTIIKAPINEPYKWAGMLSKKSSKTISKGIIPEKNKQSVIEKLMLFVRGNFFIPDARIGWVKPSVKKLSKYIKKEEIETIITTGPPHSIHLIGLKLKAQLNIKWLADFRDPWTTIGYHKQLKLTHASKVKHKQLEKQVLNTADKIIVTSSVTKQEFNILTKKPIELITNGYDYEYSEIVPLDLKFTLSHIGSLLSGRNPDILWQILKDLIKEYPGFSQDFQLNLVGAVSKTVLESIVSYKLNEYLDNKGYVSHKEAVAYQRKSQLLLLIEIDSEDTKSIIPGKLFEYMVSGRPILAIGPMGSDVEQIIKETNTGHYFGYKDYQLLKSTILEHYKAFKLGTLKTQPKGLEKYHRKSLTYSLSKLL